MSLPVIIPEDLGAVALRHTTRLVCATASTIALGSVFMDLTFVQGTTLGICGSVAWSVAICVLKHFECSPSVVRSFSHLGSVFVGIPLTGMIYGCFGGGALPLNLSITMLTLGGSLVGSLLFAAITIVAIAISVLVNNGPS